MPDPIEVANLTSLTADEQKQVTDAFDKANAELDIYTAAQKDGKTPVSFDKDFKNVIITWVDGSTTLIPSWQVFKQKAGTSIPTPAVPAISTNSKEDKLNIEIVDADASNPCHVFKAVSYNGDDGLPKRDKVSCDLPAKLNLINSTTGELLYSCDFKLKDGVFPAAITLKDVDISDDIMRTQNYDIKFSFDSYENNNKLMIGKIATQEFNNRYNVNFKATYTVERPKTETASTQTDDIQTQIKELKQKIDEANAYNEQHKLQPLLKITPGSKDGLYTLTYTPRANYEFGSDEQQPFWTSARTFDAPDFSNNLVLSNSKYHVSIIGDSPKSADSIVSLCIYNKVTHEIIGLCETEAETQSLTNSSVVGIPIKQVVIKDVPISKLDLSDVAVGMLADVTFNDATTDYHAFLPESVQYIDIAKYEQQLQQLNDILKTKNYVNIFDISEHLKQLLDANDTVIATNNYKNADDDLKQAYDAAIIAGQKVYDKLSSTPEEVKQATESIKAALGKLNGDAKVSTTISQLQSQLDAANGKIQTLSGELEKAKQQGTADKATIQSLTEQLQQAKNALEKLKSDKTLSDQQKQAEIDKLNGKIADLEKQVTQLKKEKEDLTQQLEQLNKRIEELNTKVNTCSASDGEKAKELEKVKGELKQAKQQLEQLKQDNAKSIEEKQKEITKLNGKIEELNKQVEQLTKDKGSLQQQLDTANGKVQTLTDELNKAKQQLEQLKQDKTKSDKEKQAEIDKLNGQIDELNDQIKNLSVSSPSHEQTETAKDDNKEEKPVKTQSVKQRKGKLPQTSDMAPIGAVGVLAGMLCVLAAIFKRRKL